MASIFGQKAQWKESANLRIEQQKISNLDNRENRENRLKTNKQTLRNLQEYNKRSNIYDIRGKEERLKEIMTDNFLNLTEDISPQIQETVSISNRINPKKFTERHIVLLKTKIKKKYCENSKRETTLLSIGGK